jgi:hypothetical protein
MCAPGPVGARLVAETTVTTLALSAFLRGLLVAVQRMPWYAHRMPNIAVQLPAGIGEGVMYAGQASVVIAWRVVRPRFLLGGSLDRAPRLSIQVTTGDGLQLRLGESDAWRARAGVLPAAFQWWRSAAGRTVTGTRGGGRVGGHRPASRGRGVLPRSPGSHALSGRARGGGARPGAMDGVRCMFCHDIATHAGAIAAPLEQCGPYALRQCRWRLLRRPGVGPPPSR